MIASLRGQIKAIKEKALIVEVNGVGYEVQVPKPLLGQCGGVGQLIELFTHMSVRENEIALYGFRSLEELDLFVMLNSVSGIGPRLALAALSLFPPPTLRSTILQGDVAALTRVAGIGQKTAQRIVLDLKDRLAATGETWLPSEACAADTDVMDALTALGYSPTEAQRALNSLPSDAQELDDRILEALRFLGSHS